MGRKQWLTKGGLQREDSDDELGYDDLPWEWIYDETEESSTTNTPSKKRKAGTGLESGGGGRKKRVIVGAKMGSFCVRIGDAVLLKSPEQGKDWVALVCAFSEVDEEDEPEMCAHLQWFCSPEELAFSKRGSKSNKAKPEEILPNESYITADFNLNPLTAINGKAIVLSKDAFFRKYPGGKEPKRSRAARNEYAKTILCRKGVKQRNLIFTEEFVWEEMYRGPEDMLDLVDWIKEQTKVRGKKADKENDAEFSVKRAREDDGDDEQEDVEGENDNENEDGTPKTPRKRQRRSRAGTATPQRSSAKKKRTILVTPTHKRIMVKRPLEITPLGTRILSPSQFASLAEAAGSSTPYSHARRTLHVSAVPGSLPCRSEEFSKVYSHLQSAIMDGCGACIYISGTPGTGKTATVREVVSTLHQAVLDDELDDFTFVEINGMKVTEPQQSYSLLWEALKGDRISPAHALSLLEHEFSHPSPRRVPCVVLMDELDQLVTRNQSVMYNFFNWPALRHSRLIVLAVANTMDLPERTLSNKISSRLGLTRITFPGYTHQQLMEIIASRLQGVPGNIDQSIVDADAVQFASRKVAAVSGDARRALDICRRAVEIAEQQQQQQQQQTEEGGGGEEEQGEDQGPTTPSKSGRKTQGHQATTGREQQQQQLKPLKRVTIATIKQAISEATSSPMAQHLRSLPLASKLFLAGLLARTRRTGVAESSVGQALLAARQMAEISEMRSIQEAGEVLKGQGASSGVVGDLVESGILIAGGGGGGGGERAAPVRLRIGEDEVKSAMVGDAEVAGMGLV